MGITLENYQKKYILGLETPFCNVLGLISTIVHSDNCIDIPLIDKEGGSDG